ncbi:MULTISPECIES: hypothetical protein [unclassified Ensifer]|uniref:hypothetical protein n=1 Tax=unclassified Ensifer TaxID=2633371 RepID=UPI000812F6D2|nr:MULTISPECIES: hypothetical protein [unclassified Ensifer]
MSKPITDIEISTLLQAMKAEPSGIAAMSALERQEYNRAAKARSRERQRQSVEAGAAKPNVDTARDLLADIAIMMLAADAVGSDTIMSALNRYYGGGGWPEQIKRRAKTGRLKTRILGRQSA